MIVREKVTLNGKEFTHTYSDGGYYIKKLGTEEIYSEAYDILSYVYIETDKLIPKKEDKKEKRVAK